MQVSIRNLTRERVVTLTRPLVITVSDPSPRLPLVVTITNLTGDATIVNDRPLIVSIKRPTIVGVSNIKITNECRDRAAVSSLPLVITVKTIGDKGDKGDDGADGAPGPAGADGADGATGPAGADGADGAPGPNLVSSTTGTNLTGILTGNGANVGSIVDASANWNTAYGWGDHSGAGYLTSLSGALLATGTVTGATAQSQVFTLGATLSNLTPTRLTYAGAAGVLKDSAGLTFDESSLIPSNILVTASALGAEKITNGTFPGNVSTGWTLGAAWFTGYVFTVSGITTAPVAGSTYTHNGQTFTTRYVSLTGTAPNRAGYAVMSGTGSPLSSGTLTKASGTGDATIAFSGTSSGHAFHGITGTSTLSQASSAMVTPLVVGEWYEYSFDIVYKTGTTSPGSVTCAGALSVTLDGTAGLTKTYSGQFRAVTTADLIFSPASTSRFGVDNVTLKKSTGVISGSSLLMSGSIGKAPASGAGSRFMYVPSKAALRSGYVNGTQWDDQNLGNNSVAFGTNPSASGSGAIAMGNECIASGANSVCIGDTSNVSYDNSVAIGLNCQAHNYSTISLGTASECYGYGAVAIGNSVVYGQYGVSVGGNTIYEGGLGATACGNSCFVGIEGDASAGLSSTVLGYSCTVSGSQSVGVGYLANVSADYAFAIGYSVLASGINSGVVGLNLEASGVGTIAFGYGYTESTDASFNWGYANREFQLTSNKMILGAGLAGVDYIVEFPGETNTGTFTWMEDEAYFAFDDDIKLPDNEKLILGTGDDAAVYYDGSNVVINPKVAGSGIVDILGTLQTDGYNAADGTAGATADVAVAKVGGGTRTLSFKNGLYVGYTDS